MIRSDSIPDNSRNKIISSKVCESKVKWKDPIPDKYHQEWIQIKAAFTEKKYTFPRMVTQLKDIEKTSLIIFSDASKDHYATCAYLVFENIKGEKSSTLIFSKSKIRPINSDNLTIPRMELLGALIATNAASTLIDELHIPISSVTFFCDNSAVLYWIIHKKPVDKWVSNRIITITATLNKLAEKNLNPKFRYVPTGINPADIATRGATLSELKINSLWQNGPSFLVENETKWPPSLDDTSADHQEFHCYILKIDRPAVPRGNTLLASENSLGYESIVPYYKTNSLRKLVTITNKVLNWTVKTMIKRNARFPDKPYIWQNHTMQKYAIANITKNETKKRALTLKYIINDHYVDSEYRMDIKPPVSEHIHKDNNGVYHYENSYVNKKNANLPKSLIYIMHKHPLARLIAGDSHESLLHQGPKDMATDIQQRYWIKGITTLTRSIRKNCLICKRQHGKPYKYPFATALPAVRTHACRPFQHVGLDYFGPIGYKTSSGNNGKLWAMLSTCLVTRAVHLEIVPDNSTSSFLLAMRRLIGRRGTPKSIISDNAPAFSLGYAMINADLKSMINSSQTLTSYLASKEIEVRQITPFAPWQGGVYERIVAIVKNMFFKTIGNNQFSYIEVETLLIECEGIINSRPITTNPISISDTEAIRPIDFMLPLAELSLPNGVITANNTNSSITERQTRKYLESLNATRQKLWDEFYNELYTGKKAPTYKNRAHSSEVPQIGHIVLVETPLVPRYRWPLGRITELIKSSDGKTRSVTIKCKSKLIQRAVNQLIPLELTQ
uniref:Integrase catalytic domain-containing protein n=1 Tax=Caenorhabditis japonica TaxID=281687 RepID=A0A8R1IJI6_CAEJA